MFSSVHTVAVLINVIINFYNEFLSTVPGPTDTFDDKYELLDSW